MITIIPVFFEDDQDVWCGAEGEALMLKFFKSAANAREIKKVIILTNDNSICNLSKSLNIDSYLIDIEAGTETSVLHPPGTYSSVSYLRETLKMDFENLMILNFRNPLITPVLIDEAINKFQLSKTAALISVKKSIDHPCQLNAYYKIVDIGFIHIFDNDEAIAPYLQILDDRFPNKHNNLCNQRNLYNQCYNNRRNLCNPQNLRSNLGLTKPFYFDWVSRGIQEKCASRMYVRIHDNLSIKYVPVDQASDETFKEIPPCLWLYNNPYEARLLVDLNELGKSYIEASRPGEKVQLAGVTFSDDFDCACLLLKDLRADEYFLEFNTGEVSLGPHLLRVLPVRQSVRPENSMTEIEITDFTKPFPFQFEDKDVCGIICSLLKVAQDDTYDLCEPFPSDEKLWSGSIEKTNVKTGKQIMGRQDFPEVLEPDGTFFIMNKDLISSHDNEEVLNGNANGFILEENASIQIKSKFDLLRFNAITKAMIAFQETNGTPLKKLAGQTG
ncbi:MAG: hypothetical protein JW883_14315 [Deltaproteobacteria bacterium]|nr:hypothetical protein [Deltaproteobacteria bacterium]